MPCLQVQKSENLEWENWQFFYSDIEGFEFEPGYIYKLSVREKQLKAQNIPADSSSKKYTLLKVLKKMPDARLRINDIWMLESIKNKKIEFEQDNARKKLAQIEFSVAEMRVTGNDGCNNFFGGIKTLTEDAITFTPFGSTKMACMDTDLPDQFNKALFQVSKYKIENLRLHLLNEGNETMLSFKKID